MRVANKDKSAKDLVVLVLQGGPSAEREVSFDSGREVTKALRQMGHKVIPCDIGPNNLSALDTDEIDVVFPALHGTFGEDGQLQQIMQQRHLRFVGSDAASSRLAMDKYAAKQKFEQTGLATPASALLSQTNSQNQTWSPDRILQWLTEQNVSANIGFPCVAKPNCQGSSIGVMFADDEKELAQTAYELLRKYGDCLIEQHIGHFAFDNLHKFGSKSGFEPGQVSAPGYWLTMFS